MSALTASPISQTAADTPALVHALVHALEVRPWEAVCVLFCSCTVMYSRAFVGSCASLVPGDGTRPTAARPQITGTYSTCTGARQREEEKVDRRVPERRSCSRSKNIPLSSTQTHTYR